MTAPRFRPVHVALAAAAIVVAYAGWRFAHRPTRIEGVRNVVLISIDTCRADRLGCYGFARGATPHIDALAKEGVLFEQALSPVPLTTPAHSSMLTGTYPPTHGVRLNNGIALGAANVTLAEVLRGAGYQTAAFVGGFPLDARFGLNQGFATYDDRFTTTRASSSSDAERSAEEVSRPALAWLEEHKGAPFFLFLHYYDPHLPYAPPAPFASTYADDPYEGEIAYVDSWIGRVLNRLRALGAADDTLVVVTGDHGESLGEHGEKSHGYFIYQSTQRVPLIVRAPGGRGGRRIATRVSLVDLMPTVLDLAGVAIPERVEGRSLRNELEGREAQGRARALYCESLEATQFGCGGLYGVVQDASKYIRAPRQELYDLSRDPGEASNLIEQEPRDASRLRDRLEEMLRELESAAPGGGPSSADPDAVKRLQSLGYVGGGATPETSAFDPTLPDPKDFLPAFERLEEANAAFHSGRMDEAEAELQGLVAERPDLVAAEEQLAEIARRKHRPGDAVDHYARILAILSAPGKKPAPDAKTLAEAQFNLGFALREAGKERESIARYEEALRIRPDYVDAHNSLGLALARAGDDDAAIAHYEAALKIDPNDARVRNNLGNALRRTGRTGEAILQYEEAVRLQPESVSALTNLALIRATDADPQWRNGEEAVRLAERACAAAGRDDVVCLDTLAAAYAEALRFDEAVYTAGEAATAARAAGQRRLAAEIEARAALYRSHRPYRP